MNHTVETCHKCVLEPKHRSAIRIHNCRTLTILGTVGERWITMTTAVDQGEKLTQT